MLGNNAADEIAYFDTFCYFRPLKSVCVGVMSHVFGYYLLSFLYFIILLYFKPHMHTHQVVFKSYVMEGKDLNKK